jgi:scyllo-inositol 2-dehydrogenase (NADP+)
MENIGVGLASFGMSGRVFHGPLLLKNPGFKIISILERSKNLSVPFYPDAHIVRHFSELLEHDEVELIIVNTPDPLHYEMTKAALMAGKHVVVEKPFVQSSAEGQELIDIASDRNLQLSVFQNRRWDGDFLTVREIIEKGYLGKLVDYEAHFDRYRNFIQEGTWKENPESGTGTLFNLGSHLIDQALVLFGLPDYVYADLRTLRTDGKIDDAFTIWLWYGDFRVTLKSSYLVREPGPRYIVHGTKGSFLKYGIDPQEEDLKAGKMPDDSNWGKETESDWGLLNAEKDGQHSRGKYETLRGDYPRYYSGIYNAIRNGDDLPVTATEANFVIRIIEAAYESSRSGIRIPFTD